MSNPIDTKSRKEQDLIKEDEEIVKQIAEGNEEVLDQVAKEDELEEKKKDDHIRNYVTDAKGWWLTALRVAEYGQYLLGEIDFQGPGWAYECVATDGKHAKILGKTFETRQGVVVAVRTPAGDIFARAMSIHPDSEVDIRAIETLVVQAENTVDFITGKLELNSGIIT